MHVTFSEWQPSPRALPDDTAVFAVGDIHGCLDLLLEMQAAIWIEIEKSRHSSVTVVYVGDYIDRGRHSREVLRTLSECRISDGATEIHLAGNHDQFLIELIGDNELDFDFLRGWLDVGGLSTLTNLGIPFLPGYATNLERLKEKLLTALGPQIVRFLRGLEHYYCLRDFVFVHAGIDPTTPLDENDLADMLLIREPFLTWTDPWPHPFCVVHGHTPAVPEVLPYRINVDTGAFYTDALTAVQIEGERLRFLTVSQEPDLDWESAAQRGILRRCRNLG